MCRSDSLLILLLITTSTCGADDLHYDTIVVGVGAAGAAAASRLAARGHHLLAVDAMPRIGGRVCTTHYAGAGAGAGAGGVVEMGAEWIHGTVDSSVYSLAVSNNVSVKEEEYNVFVHLSDGTLESQGLMELAQAGIGIYLEESNTANRTQPMSEYVADKFDKLVADKHPEFVGSPLRDTVLDYVNLLVDAYEGSESWADVNANNAQESLRGHQAVGWEEHGYSTLFDILLNKYNNGSGFPNLNISLDTEVSRIRWDRTESRRVEVVTTRGRTYTADNVIVTVSLGVLKERHASLFYPPLPSAKVTAIDVLPMGTIGKVVLMFDHEWWERREDMFAFIWLPEHRSAVQSHKSWITRIAYATVPRGARGLLTLWTTGDVAKLVEVLDENVVMSGCMELLHRFLGQNRTIPAPIGMKRTQWFANPLTRGTYSYDGVRNSAVPNARIDLAKPLCSADKKLRVLFAGEATHATRFSNVHGAVDSGYREAARIIDNVQDDCCC